MSKSRAKSVSSVSPTAMHTNRRSGSLRPPGLDGPVERGLARLVGAEAEVPAAHADRGEEDDDAVLAEVRSSAAWATSAGPMALVAITRCHVSASTCSSGRQRRHRGGVEERVEAAHGVDRLADQLAAPFGVGDVGGDRRSRCRRWSTTSASLSALRPTTVIPAPASAAARAVPRPMPAEPPTTRMRFPERSMSTCLPPTVRRPRARAPSPCRRPAHIETTPWVCPRRRSSFIMVTTMRAPVAAIG